jgi:hemerythrin superfamily protein
MSSTKRKGNGNRQNGKGRRKDAIALLKADHREVEKLFSQFKKASDVRRKEALAGQICDALKVHTKIEEEIFYPAFFEATGDTELHHEAEVEHANAKKMIAEIESMSARDDYYDAKVSVLSEMIKHHVKEEEQPGGMFSEARKSDMDLVELGEQLKARKDRLDENNGKGGLRAVASRLLEA